MTPWGYTLIIWCGAVLALIGTTTTVHEVIVTGNPVVAVFLGGPTLVAASATGIAAQARRETVTERDDRDLADANEQADALRRV